MKYTLLTGASGFLGAYLLHDMLRAGIRCAALVRPGRLETARQRIDAVLARFEKISGTVCPRPVILEGSLEENLGLDEAQTEWVRLNCDRVLHNAASLLFEEVKETGEPYRSNVHGLRHVLNFAKKTNIENFHHVSTAYVCGLRTGLCREDELDVGQQWGNAYELSKVEAEKMVLAAGFPIPPTFYRPAIITGDSRDGYTSTFHGFYTPLKVVAALLANVSDPSGSEALISTLSMTGEEHKNFVPVDWVSEGIVRLMQNPENLGKTFHFTPRNRVTAKEIYEVFITALVEYALKHPDKLRKPDSRGAENIGWDALLDTYREQMRVYESYWRDDPTFDTTNTSAALADFPCPAMDVKRLMLLARFALDVNFGWPRPRPFVPPMIVAENLPVKPSFAPPAKAETCFGLQVNGPGGGQWTVGQAVVDGTIRHVEQGLPSLETGVLSMNSEVFRLLKEGKLSPADAIRTAAVMWQEPETRKSPRKTFPEVETILTALTK